MLLASVLVGLATIGGFILLVIPAIHIGVRLAVSVQALVVAGLITGVVNAVITPPFNNTGWFVQAIAAAVATIITLPYGVSVGVLLYPDLRARKENLDLERLRTDLQASAALTHKDTAGEPPARRGAAQGAGRH